MEEVEGGHLRWQRNVSSFRRELRRCRGEGSGGSAKAAAEGDDEGKSKVRSCDDGDLAGHPTPDRTPAQVPSPWPLRDPQSRLEAQSSHWQPRKVGICLSNALLLLVGWMVEAGTQSPFFGALICLEH